MDFDDMYNYDLHETITDPYENFLDNLAYQEEWTFWGRKGFNKPIASKIWITTEFDEKPTISPPPRQILGEYDFTSVFPVVPQEYTNCIPTSVQLLLMEYNVINNVLEASSQKYFAGKNSIISRQKSFPDKDTHISSHEHLPDTSQSIDGQSGCSPSHSSENLASAGSSASFLQHKEVVYDGIPTIYRKPDEVKDEKNGKDRKGKKALKQKKKKESCIFLEETENNLNGIMPFDIIVTKKYTLNINQPPNEQFKPHSGYATNQKLETAHELLEHFQHGNESPPINSASNFPALSSDELVATSNYVESSGPVFDQEEEPLYVQDKTSTGEELCDVLIIENIPLSVDDKEFNDFIMTFGNVVIIEQKECGNMLSVTLKIEAGQGNAQWIADCMDGQSPFGACSEPVKCYIRHTNGF